MISLAKREFVEQQGQRTFLRTAAGVRPMNLLREIVKLSPDGAAAAGLAVPLSVRCFTDFAIPISPSSVVLWITAAIFAGAIIATEPGTRQAHLNPVEALKS
jgi:hypothetical protein